MIAICDTDGVHLVVWGVGRTEASARRDAGRQEDYESTEHEVVAKIDAARAARIVAGYIDASDLAKPKPAPRTRAAQLLVRLSDEERAIVVAAAKRADKPVVWWMRAALLLAAAKQR